MTINFENGSWIRSFGSEPSYHSSRTDKIIWVDSNGEQHNVFEIKRQIAECDTWRSPPAISTDTYGPSCRNIDLFKQEYEEVQEMRALFVTPEVYDTVCNWYEELNNIQKHRKVTAIFKSPAEFRDQFNKDKFGAQYTMFYFDDMLFPIDVLEYFKEFVRLYGEEDARYISEAMKIRMIDIGKLMLRNNFDCFTSTCIDPSVIDDVIQTALLEQTECYCESLL